MLELETDRYRASVLPEDGGLVASLQWMDAGGWTNILRPDPGKDGVADGVPLFGCFPMVPFANRLSVPRLQSGLGAVALPVNWPIEGLAMHGVGFSRPWALTERDDTRVLCSAGIDDASGNPLGEAVQDIALNDAGLAIVLSFRNTSDTWLDCGVGLHPWFHTPAGQPIRIGFGAAGRLETTDRNLPCGKVAESDKPIDLDWSDAGLDSCFYGWDGAAILDRPKERIRVSVASSAPTLHCFVARQFDAVSLEPVSHAPDAAHSVISRAVAPMKRLQPGDRIAVDMAIGVAPLNNEGNLRT